MFDIAVKRDIDEGSCKDANSLAPNFHSRPLWRSASSPPRCGVGYVITRDPSISVPLGVSLWALKKESLPVGRGTLRNIDNEKERQTLPYTFNL